MSENHTESGYTQGFNFCDILSKQSPSLIKRKHQTNPVGGHLQDTWSGLLKTTKVMENKRRWRNCQRPDAIGGHGNQMQSGTGTENEP